MEPSGSLRSQTAINPGSPKLEKQIFSWYVLHSTLTRQAAAPFLWENCCLQEQNWSVQETELSEVRLGSHRKKGLWEAGLFVASVLTGQGSFWGSACSSGIRVMRSVKKGKKITRRQNPHLAQCTVQGWVWDQMSAHREVPEGAQTSLPGHHSWAGWAGTNRIFS